MSTTKKKPIAVMSCVNTMRGRPQVGARGTVQLDRLGLSFSPATTPGGSRGNSLTTTPNNSKTNTPVNSRPGSPSSTISKSSSLKLSAISSSQKKVSHTFGVKEVERKLYVKRPVEDYAEYYQTWLSSDSRSDGELVEHLKLMDQHCANPRYTDVISGALTKIPISKLSKDSKSTLLTLYLQICQKFYIGKPSSALAVFESSFIKLIKIPELMEPNSEFRAALRTILSQFSDYMSRGFNKAIKSEWPKELDYTNHDQVASAKQYVSNLITLFNYLVSSPKCRTTLFTFLISRCYPDHRGVTKQEYSEFGFVDNPGGVKSDSEMETTKEESELKADADEKLYRNQFVDFLMVRLMQWIDSDDMTDEEKSNLWHSLIGAFLKMHHNIITLHAGPMIYLILYALHKWDGKIEEFYTFLMSHILPDCFSPKKALHANEKSNSGQKSSPRKDQIYNPSLKDRQRLAHWLATFLIHSSATSTELLEKFLVTSLQWLTNIADQPMDKSDLRSSVMFYSLTQCVIRVVTWRFTNLRSDLSSGSITAISKHLNQILGSKWEPARALPDNLKNAFIIGIVPHLGVNIPLRACRRSIAGSSGSENLLPEDDLIQPFDPLLSEDDIPTLLAGCWPESTSKLEGVQTDISLVRSIISDKLDRHHTLMSGSAGSGSGQKRNLNSEREIEEMESNKRRKADMLRLFLLQSNS